MRRFTIWMFVLLVQSAVLHISLATDRQKQQTGREPLGAGTIRQEEEILQTVFPNPFTPNNDGYNDYVEFTFSESVIQKPVIYIYNLRGKRVCEINPGTNRSCQWNGRDDSGNDLEPGVYIYILNTDNSQSINGTITLIR